MYCTSSVGALLPRKLWEHTVPIQKQAREATTTVVCSDNELIKKLTREETGRSKLYSFLQRATESLGYIGVMGVTARQLKAKYVVGLFVGLLNRQLNAKDVYGIGVGVS